MTARQPEPDAQSVSLIAIQEQLDRLLSCSSFHNSRRYPKFLKYVVEKGISGSLEELKERVIGVEVFERPTDYEPATDPIVRLVAGETRKRLAQYYLQTEHGDELRVDIPPGSYAPIFYWPQWASLGGHDSLNTAVAGQNEAATGAEILSGPAMDGVLCVEADLAPAAYPASASSSHSHHVKALLLGALAAVVLVAGLVGSIWWIRTAPERHLKTFWEPMLSANPSMLICIGDWANSTPGRGDRRYVGPYDLAALARLAGLLSSTSRLIPN